MRRRHTPQNDVSDPGHTPGRWRFPEDVRAWFQPICSLHQRRVVGLEALARVQDDQGHILSPAAFLPSLDSTQRRELSRLMLTAGVQFLEHMDAEGIPLDLSFNVDPDFMEDHDCAPCFLGVMESSQISPERITLELLESGDFLNGDIAVHRLEALRRTGAHIALDDIGSAYSSLLRLKTLPIQKIKLDQDLVRDLHRQPRNLAFVQSIQFLAEGLGCALVVEGVESVEILDAMIALNLDLVQGYALARPMDAEATAAYLRRPCTLTDAIDSGPQTLLGAYAGHLLRRPLLHSVQRGGAGLSLADFFQDCPLLLYLKAQGAPAEHPVFSAYDELLGRQQGGLSHRQMDAMIDETEQMVQRLMFELMAKD